MEFLLINHPLDCPICDQGGECDLQDQAMAYGFDRGRFHENKRAVRDKDFGPLVETEMTRCIHCTRCIRFLTDVAGVEELGATGRGEDMEIGTYIERALTSELSANIIDLCPVGALTSKPYAFVARPWELIKTESVDVLDAVGSNIRIDARDGQVLRVLPRLNEAINEEWISDKTRFAIDGLRRRRLDRPYAGRNGKRAVDWREALRTRRRPAARDAGRAHRRDRRRSRRRRSDVRAEGADERRSVPATSIAGRTGPKLDPRCRAGYLFNTTIAGIEQADLCLLIGTNPRCEAPLVNARLRKRYLHGGFRVAAIGPALDLTFPVEMLGAGGATLAALADGTHPWAARLRGAKNPMLILGQGALTGPTAPRMLAGARGRLPKPAAWCARVGTGSTCCTARPRASAASISASCRGRAVMTPAASSPAARRATSRSSICSAPTRSTCAISADAFVIYQGHHGDAGARRADVVLPGRRLYREGRHLRQYRGPRAAGAAGPHFRRAKRARIGRSCARSRAPSAGRCRYDSLGELRRRLGQSHPVFAERRSGGAGGMGASSAKTERSRPIPFAYPIADFYRTDPISRASRRRWRNAAR